LLTVELGSGGLGRIRFASAPAPVLETVLILLELRNRPSAPNARRDWRARVTGSFPVPARPLLDLVPSRDRAFYLDVLTADAQEAFAAVHDTAASIHADNVDRIEKATGKPAPLWLRRYAEGERTILQAFDRALRAFHETCLASQWEAVTARFHEDVELRSTLTRDHGLATMLESLHPSLRLTGDVLAGPYPWRRTARLDRQGLVLMPSAFWTGHPLLTWDPLEPTRHVLIYPAMPDRARPGERRAGDPAERGAGQPQDPATALAAVFGATRAAVLATLTEPTATGAIAKRLGISPASASQHASALRDARLIESRRRGKLVEHRLTPLGISMLRHAAPSPVHPAG
jgi:DNA-binding transcriptional ArsR family regulator